MKGSTALILQAQAAESTANTLTLIMQRLEAIEAKLDRVLMPAPAETPAELKTANKAKK